MRYQVIVETIVDETGKTEWIIGGQFYQKALADLFARSYEWQTRNDGLEAIVVDLERKESFCYADTDSVKNLKKQKLNSLYGMYARGDI